MTHRVNIWLITMLFGAFALGAVVGLPSIGWQMLRALSFNTIPLWSVAAALIVIPILLKKV